MYYHPQRMGRPRRFVLKVWRGLVLMTEEGELGKTFRNVLIGNLARWIYIWAEGQIETTIAAFQASSALAFDPGEILLRGILARVLISLILSGVVVAAIWRWLSRNFTPAHRRWVAFAIGFYAEPTSGWLVRLFQLLITGVWPT